MRILMICHMPWQADLGGPKVQLELARELVTRGHTVDKFSLEDAFSGKPEQWLVRGLVPRFARKAEAFVKQQSKTYDVIDAHQGNLLVSKQRLSFTGVLVVRSAGLAHFHNDALRRVHGPLKTGARGKVGWARTRLVLRANSWASERSFTNADVVIAINRAEVEFLKQSPAWKPKVRFIPNALNQASLNALAAISESRALLGRAVSFIGSWDPLKGSLDLGAIFKFIQEKDPSARFKILGCRRPFYSVAADLPNLDPSSIGVVSSYQPRDLPGLLSDVRVGVFPSYTEGFGLGVLEQLGAGIPVVAYDVPGPRDLLEPIAQWLLVPPGNKRLMAQRAAQILTVPPNEYAQLSARCKERAGLYSWATLADRTLQAYSRIGAHA